MNLNTANRLLLAAGLLLLGLPGLARTASAQTLINVDFGVGTRSAKTGFAATGLATNDFWNLYRHYDPKFAPGMKLVNDGRLEGLKLADGTVTAVSLSVSNAPGVWGNATGDPMYDTYIFARNASNITVTINGLDPGRYHFYVYGHAEPDVTGEQNSLFTLRAGTNTYGPLAPAGSAGWKASLPWQERCQYGVFRDIETAPGEPVVIDVAPGPNGVAVLNGLQILSRGTSPPEVMRPAIPVVPFAFTNLMYREVRYEGQVAENEARFLVSLEVESMATNEITAPLFTGDLAVISSSIPSGLRLTSAGKQYRLSATAPGVYRFQLEVYAKITRAEPWNVISFTGPAAAIASLSAQASGPGVELQMLSGTPESESARPGSGTNETIMIRGLVGADRAVSLRWQSRATEVARKSFVTVQTTIHAQVTPTVVKFTTAFHYQMLQAGLPRLSVALPSTHALTRLQGEQIRDWQVKPEGDHQVLSVEFIKPVEKDYDLTVFSEQTIETTPVTVPLIPPQPLAVERESGAFTIAAADMVAELEAASGLRQINAPADALAAFRFYGRPFALSARLKRIEPVLQAVDRVAARLEETRLIIRHSLALNVEKAGIYSLELTPQKDCVVAEVRGEGIADWKAAAGKLRVDFGSRVLGARQLDVLLEQPLKPLPKQMTILPLRVSLAAKETAEIGAASSPGLRVKTAQLDGLREIPVNRLSWRTDELLAYTAERPDWQLVLATEQLEARILADVFNLVTVGDGLVGGSATLRYGIINQGVQEFRVQVPAHWKNLEFTGPNIRRKEFRTNEWIIGLQDKVWNAYTLVITYDFAFDPKGATLAIGGAHPVGVERETGSLALTSAAGLELKAKPAADPLRRIDESELSATDRALITRPVLLAYRYLGSQFDLAVEANRFESLPVLEAVADRTQLTTVLTEAGQMLTQASFMVKNNQKQFQRFQLPAGSEFWSCYVNGQATKTERDADWLLVPLPRGVNRDQAFAVDLVYAQKISALGALRSQKLELLAPRTDVPNTYAEWQVFVPATCRLAGFDGNMTVTRGAVYDWHDAWTKFTGFYLGLGREIWAALVGLGAAVVLLTAVVIAARRRGWRGVWGVGLAACLVLILAGMLLPALSRAKSRSLQSLPQAAVVALDDRTQTPSSPISPSAKPAESLEELSLQTQPPAGLEQRYGAYSAGRALSDSRPRGDAIARGTPASVNAPLSRASAALMTAGIRPIRIDIPREGYAFMFTKVLNVGGEPLSVRARITRLRVLVAVRMAAQLVAFLAGLWLWRRQWRRAPRGSLLLTLGLLLIIGALASLLLGWGILHQALILGAPLLLAAILAFFVWRCWPPHSTAPSDQSGPNPPPAGGTGSGVAPLAVLVVLSWLAATAAAADVKPDAALTPLDDHSAMMPRPTRPATNAVSILAASYTGNVQEKVARIDVTLRLSASQSNQIVRLFGEDVLIQSFVSTPAGLQLLREGNEVGVRLPEPGEANLQFKCLVKLGGNDSQRQLAFDVPSALFSRFSLDLDEPDAEVEFPAAVSFKRSSAARQTHIEALLGAGERVDLRWTPRVKRAAEIAATVFCQNSALISLGGGVVNTRAVLDYQVSQGELRQARVRLPAGHRLLRVEGESIRSWDVTASAAPPRNPGRDGAPTAAGAILNVELLKGISPGYRLTIETEQLLGTLPAQLRLDTPHALDVKRETGLIALRPTEELNVTADAKDLQRVDAEEFARTTASEKEGLISVFRFLKPEFDLTVRVESVQPQIEAVVRNATHLGAEQIDLAAQLDYVIKRAGVFALKVALPAGYRLENVAGARIQQWIERQENDRRWLEITLKERTLGSYSLRLELTQSLRELPKSITVAGIVPQELDKLTGFITVSSEPGLAVKTSSFTGLTEIPASSVLPFQGSNASPASASSILAFKFIAETPATTPGWQLVVATENVEPWVRAEIVSALTVSETLLSGKALIRYDIQNAPIKELRVRVPAAFTNIELTGANIRRRDQAGDQWRVELQNKIRGAYVLTVTWDQPRPAKTNLLAIEGVHALDVERETGLLTLGAQPPLQVVELSAADLQKVDASDSPDWAGRLDETAVLAYRYLRPGYKLAVEVKRFEEAEVLQAIVDNARLATVVADDGQTMTEMVLAIRNNGRQNLEVAVPPDCRVWSAFVAGQPVQPSRREGKLLLPLERSGADGAPVAVELTFVGATPFPRARGSLRLLSPTLDLPLKNVRWELYLPPDYQYDGFGGTMTHESGAINTSPVALSYTLSEYTGQENRKQTRLRAEVQSDLSSVQKKLAEGNVKEAAERYQQARFKAKSNLDEAADKDFKQLETELRRAQSSNLIQGQTDFLLRNQSQMIEARPTPQPGSEREIAGAFIVNYDNAAAEKQWAKLQQAQEIAAPKIQPLRVNLPTRGVRLAFAQVLQTEIRKPMTIQFTATNTRFIPWPTRLLGGGLGFLALWALAAWILRQSSARKNH